MCAACFECIARNSTVAPMVNQMQYHAGMGEDPGGLVSYCKAKGIVFEAYSPLGGGRLLGNFTVGEELAAKYNFSSSAGVALAYVAQRGRPFVTKSDNPVYLAEDLDLFSPEKQLSAADLARIDALAQPECRVEAPGGCCHADGLPRSPPS